MQQARTVEAWATNSISKSTTWNKQPAWVTKLSTVNVAKGWGSSCLPGGVEFDVTPQVVDAAAKKWPNDHHRHPGHERDGRATAGRSSRTTRAW